MQEETIKYLSDLQIKVQKERDELHKNIFIDSHPILIPGDYEQHRREIKRYQKFHEGGFNSSKAIERMVKLDFVIGDLESILWRNKENKKEDKINFLKIKKWKSKK
ncbi:MAG TPA: hypothetical protein DDY52_03400 [Candidatus Moranbacteria bacterium]|nr:hypothetical protein [Candidatus Moranbacteria bacterium]